MLSGSMMKDLVELIEDTASKEDVIFQTLLSNVKILSIEYKYRKPGVHPKRNIN